jgi:hypothetical protein
MALGSALAGAAGAMLVRASPKSSAVAPAASTVVRREIVLRNVLPQALPEHGDVAAPGSETAEDVAALQQETPEEAAARVATEREATFQADNGPQSELTHNIAGILTDAFRTPGSEITNLQCRSSTCRLDLTFDNPDLSEQTLRQVFLSPAYPDLGRLASTVTSRELDNNGQTHIRVYLYKDRDNSSDQQD